MVHRQLVVVAALSMVGWSARCAAGQEAAEIQRPPSPGWVAGITRVAYTDLPNGIRMEDWPEKVIADFGKAGVQLMFSRVHNGSDAPGLYWKSAYGPTDPAMSGRDGTREVVALCHKRNIRYMAYLWAQREAPSLAAEHPDWQMRDSAGRPNGYFCANTGYRNLVRSRIVELVKEVGVDGIFFDMYHVVGGACYCPTCTTRFRAQTGQAPPLREDFSNPLWQQWCRFRYRSIEEALLDYNRSIKAANPQAALMVNSWNAWVVRNPGNLRSSIRVAECVDGLLEEVGWYDVADPAFWAYPASFNFMNWHLAGLCKQTRAFMWGAPSLPGWQVLGYQEPAIRVMTMLTNGAVPAHSVSGRDAMARWMADIAAREKYTRGARLAPWCGMVVSEKAELWYGRDNPKDRYLKGLYGAFQAMLERHLPMAMVTDRDLELGRPLPYRVLFLPNCAAMGEREMEAIRRYVRDGGSVVATYETSLYDGQGTPRADLGLADLLHAHRTGSVDARGMNPWEQGPRVGIRFPADHPWVADPIMRRTFDVRDVHIPVDRLGLEIPLAAGMLAVSPQGATPSTIRLKATTTGPDGVATTNTPALVQSRYGKGRVTYIPFDISWSFYRYGHEYLARIMELAIRQAAGVAPPVETDAPSTVQVMPQVQQDRLVVHLLNDISSTGRGQVIAGEAVYLRREVVPVHDIHVTFTDRSLDRFLLVPGERPLAATETPEGRRVTVPRLDIHAMVVAWRSGRHGTREIPLPVATVDRPAVPVVRGPDLLKDGAFAVSDSRGLQWWRLAQPADGAMSMATVVEEGRPAICLTGSASWACAEGERVPIRKGTRYLLTGLARAEKGDACLQISYWRGSQWLGCTVSDPVNTDGAWQEYRAASELERFPAATEFSISCTGHGATRAWFRSLLFTTVTAAPVRKPGGPRRSR